jgi:SAM-dependent methyltransferase
MPALVDFENSVLDAERLLVSVVAPDVRLARKWIKRYLAPLLHGKNRIASSVVARMLELLSADAAGAERRPRILVVGGGTVGSGLKSLYSNPAIELIAFDIYVSPYTQFVGDGHAIPLADASVDGVVIQAVLEHVLEPSLVAQEIHRVLREGGIAYADTPFMQQVHGGPYDFTRFTDSGHRYLFRRFELIDSGVTAGAGTALLWSIERFVRALTRSARFGQLANLCFFWLRSADAILDPMHSLDAASGIFFLGRKRTDSIKRAEIISYYRGRSAPRTIWAHG